MIERRLREAKVQDFHNAIGRHLDVRWLQVAMDDALLVCGIESLGDLTRSFQRLANRQSTDVTSAGRFGPQAIGQRLALDELEHQSAKAIAFCYPIDGRDVRVIERCEHTGLAVEAGAAIRVERE